MRILCTFFAWGTLSGIGFRNLISLAAEVEIEAVDGRQSTVHASTTTNENENAVPSSSAKGDGDESTASLSNDLQVKRAAAIMEWIANSKDQGGFVNDKIEIRRSNSSDFKSPIGVFAAESIEKGEVLTRVPWSLMIRSDNPKDRGQMPCGTVRALQRELQLGNESNYAPYIEYLLNEDDSSAIPSCYTEPGKKLLLEVLGGSIDKDGDVSTRIPPADPLSWIDEDWIESCQADPNNKEGIRAATLVLQRSDDALLIPGYDLYNHRNGKWLNTVTHETTGEFYELRSSRAIEKEEEIYNTYNFCADCGGRKEGYGTPEILRDYGFLEHLPQRWHTETDRMYQWDVDENEDGTLYIVKWNRKPKNGERLDRLIITLQNEMRRLRRLKNIAWRLDRELRPIDNLPFKEWDTIRNFVEANIKAYGIALDSLKEWTKYSKFDDSAIQLSSERATPFGIDTYSVTAEGSHYDPLYFEPDDNAYELYTCDTDDAFGMVGFDEVEELQTSYQSLEFNRREDTDDLCMSLDNIIQICANYRPHYHEFITHTAGRYIERVKRIMFIGGGDSMLLHEALKYPDLEKVVGLELDQTVTRKSFKHFHTSPHFEDDRVEWWFGDATKSLLLLPEQYWGSFDLVLVDLSETAMSLSVTDELDVFDALALLLNPHGVMVKNELYFEKFCQVFDYTMEIYYESPVICSQVAVLGSNNVDFFHAATHNHGLKNFLYKDLHQDDTRHDLLHDYRKNLASSEACNVNAPTDPTEQLTAAGVMEIINAESVKTELDGSIIDMIETVLKRQGLDVVSHHFLYQTAVVIFEEGYIAARIWPEHDYVGFDIFMAGQSFLIPNIRQSLTDAIGSDSKDVSFYKVVVGGIYGLSSWRFDHQKLGPKNKVLRNCNHNLTEEGSLESLHAFRIAVDEIVALTNTDKNVAIVFCGKKDSCASSAVLADHQNVNKILSVGDCDKISPFQSIEDMYKCERNTLLELYDKLNGTKANLMVVDADASFEMHQIALSMLEDDIDRNNMFEKHAIYATWSHDEEMLSRREFLDRIRKAIKFDPVSRAEIVVQAGVHTYELGVVSSNDERAVYAFEMLEQRLVARLSADPFNAMVELRNVHGSMFNYDDDFQPVVFRREDYDLSAAREQFQAQIPLGRQVIIQFGLKDLPGKRKSLSSDFQLSLSEVSRMLSLGLNHIDLGLSTTNLQYVLGDGGAVVSVGSTGNYVAVWDGRVSIVVNFFTFEERNGTPERFVKDFTAASNGRLEVKLQDDQPRGIHRVINFPSDMKVATS